MKTDQAVLAKIQKLLALAEGKGTTPGESANAAAAAQDLMQRHKLSRAVVEGANSEGIDDSLREPLWTGSRYTPWRADLAAALSQINDCIAFASPGIKGRPDSAQIAIVGRPSDITVVRYLFGYLEREIDRLAREALRRRREICEQQANLFGHDESTEVGNRTWARSFRFGAVATVKKRVRQARNDAERDEADALRKNQGAEVSRTALVHMRERGTAIKRWLDEQNLGTRASYDGDIDGHGYLSGKAAAQRIPIHKGLKS